MKGANSINHGLTTGLRLINAGNITRVSAARLWARIIKTSVLGLMGTRVSREWITQRPCSARRNCLSGGSGSGTKKRRDEMRVMSVDERARCRFIGCAAGMGLAGMGVCFMRGEWDNPKCPKFMSEEEFIKEHENQRDEGVEG